MPQENGKPHFVRKPHRHWVNIFLIKYGDWELVPALIGHKGKNLSDINVATNAKARVRGRGSRHFEVNGKGKGKNPKEAQVPLQLSISTAKTDPDNFQKAVDMAVMQLEILTTKWKVFCESNGMWGLINAPIFAFAEVALDTAPLVAHHVQAFPRQACSDPWVLDRQCHVQAGGRAPLKVPPPGGIRCYVQSLGPNRPESAAPEKSTVESDDYEKDLMISLRDYYAGIEIAPTE
jgi:hypothetical protein